MTIEQKAKAYDEALERARSLQHDNGWVTTIFPELKESEDEKIRGKIVSILEQYALICAKEGDPCLELNDCLAYLEKQKVPADGDFARGYDCGYECCLHSHGAEWFERQKKQKPAEWSEEDKNKFDLLHTCICLCINDPYWEYSKREKVSKELIPFIEKFKFLRPSWKPSEEQIHALWKLMHNAVFLSSWGELEKEIESLYKDLKKL